MAALDYLRRAGLAVELEGNRLRVTPADLITADLRQFVRDHRAELLAELSAANDAQPASEPRRNAWTVTRKGRPVGYIVGQPMTRSEALADVSARGWPDADILEN